MWPFGFWTWSSQYFNSLILLVLMFLLAIEKLPLGSVLGPWHREKRGEFGQLNCTNGKRFCQTALPQTFDKFCWREIKENWRKWTKWASFLLDCVWRVVFFFLQQIYIASNQPSPFSPYSIICTFTSALANICSLSYEPEYWLSSNQMLGWFPILLSISCY